jgi:shikimate kinase
MRIFLIGFMGIGKSTLGKMVAQALNYEFWDFDTIIEEDMGMSISSIFAQYGEVFFRKVEHDTLGEVIQTRTDFVMGTGGGLPCFNDNMTKINEHGCSVYLRATANEIAARLADSSGDRPLIQNKSREELKQYVTDLLEIRNDFYLRSHLIIDLDLGLTKRENAARIVKELTSYLSCLPS